jgi:hypothetical protein
VDAPLLTCDQLLARTVVGGGEPSPGEVPVLVVDLSRPVADGGLDPLVRQLVTWPWVVIGVGPTETHRSGLGRLVDLAVEPDDPALGAIVANVATWPIAAVTLALLLRSSSGLAAPAGLVAESAAYSTLQAGPEFATWRASSAHAPAPVSDRPVVRVEPRGVEVHVVLDRPARHNAIDRQLRLELHDALRVAAAAGAAVVLRGEGPSFSSGGDLGEFGSFADPASAHLVRMRNHPAVAMVALGPERTRAVVHGACAGGGLELAAFAGHVTARPDAWFQLPELGLGLVPGAGGTVSLPRRIGRQRTARLALAMERLDAAAALAWGLVDAVDDG